MRAPFTVNLVNAFLFVRINDNLTHLEIFPDKTELMSRVFVVPGSVIVTSLAARNASTALTFVVVVNSRKMLLTDVTQEYFWTSAYKIYTLFHFG